MLDCSILEREWASQLDRSSVKHVVAVLYNLFDVAISVLERDLRRSIAPAITAADFLRGIDKWREQATVHVRAKQAYWLCTKRVPTWISASPDAYSPNS